MSKKVEVKQVRSKAARVKAVYDTLDALGLGRIGKKKVITLNDCTQGMINKVSYLLEVKEVK